MRILIATGLYPPEIGGPATYAKLLEDRLPARGIEVTVLPFSTVRHLPVGIRHIVYMWKIFTTAKNVDLILVQDTVSTGLPAAIAAFVSGKKLIVRVPGDYAWEQGVQRFGVKDTVDEFQKHSYGFFVGMLRMIQRFVIRRAHRVIAPSNYFAKVIKQWSSSSIAVTVIYNGIEMPVPTEAIEERPQGFTVVAVGRLVPWKGMDGIIRVVAQEKKWNAVIVGDGPQWEHLAQMIKDHDCAERIQLVGQLPRAQALGWVKSADALVLNSTYEGLSHLLVEAMSLGAPIVATNIDGNAEIATDVAVLIHPNSDEELRAALKDLELDTEKSNRLRALGPQRAKVFSIEKTVEATAKLLLSV